MKQKLTLLSFLLFMLLHWSAVAQDALVSGKIKDTAGEPVIGANILIKGTKVGTITDLNGLFKLSIPASVSAPVLQISSIGYLKQEVAVGGRSSIDVMLEADVEQLEEVVVVGYGIQKKSDLTGALSSVKAADVAALPVPNAAQALQGRAAGVQVTANSGAPGAGMAVTIRGLGSVNGASPLYVVDGMLLDDISFLNPNDIDNIDILKDASATAIYGSRGANGVVIVTTKKGKSGAPVITLDSYVGVQQAWKKPDLLNSEEWYNVVSTANKNGGKVFNLSPDANNLKHTTNWFEEVTQSAPMQSHNLSVSGGTDASRYLASVNYFQQDGIVRGSTNERLTFRLNLDNKVGKYVKYGVNMALNNTKYVFLPSDYFNGIINASLKLDPITPVRKPDGSFQSSPYTDVMNPVAYIDRYNSPTLERRMVSSAYLDVQPLKGLTLRSSLGLDLAFSKTKTFEPAYFMAVDEQKAQSTASHSASQSLTWLWENTATYTRTFEKHSITALAGVTAQRSTSEWVSALRNGVPGTAPELQYPSAGLGGKEDGQIASGSGSASSIYSLLGRVNYSYDDRYMLTASIRRDGSSRFGPGNRFGNFPSVAVAWRLINESFMKNLDQNILSDLKLRAGWGQVGNQGIPNYQYNNTLYAGLENGAVFNNTVRPGAAIDLMANTTIKWEAVESSNVGIDMAFFSNKLTLSTDYFVRETQDMLIRKPLPTYSGFVTNPYANIGNVSNEGVEVTLGWRDQTEGGFSYGISVNAAHIKNTVGNLGGPNVSVAGGGFRIGSTTLSREGSPVGAFYGYAVDGIFQTQEEVTNYAKDGKAIQPAAIPGDFRYKDLNGDGKITADDRQIIGSPHPDLFFGLNFDAAYKGFDLLLFVQGTYGNDIMNAMKFHTLNAATVENKDRAILGAWTPGSGVNDMPGLNVSSKNDNTRLSSWYVEDGSYLRVKNVQLGYTLPAGLTKKLGIANWRFYVGGANLLTLTKYSGLDPEIGGGTLSMGVDTGAYPAARVWTAGTSLRF